LSRHEHALGQILVPGAAVGGGELLVGPRGVVARRLFEQVKARAGVSDPGVDDRLVVEPVALGRPEFPRVGERSDPRRGPQVERRAQRAVRAAAAAG